MEPNGSFPCLQEPAICPYSEPDQSTPCSPSYFLEINPNIIFPYMPGFSKGLFPLGFPHKTLYAPVLSSIHAMCSTHLILIDLKIRIICGEEY